MLVWIRIRMGSVFSNRLIPDPDLAKYLDPDSVNTDLKLWLNYSRIIILCAVTSNIRVALCRSLLQLHDGHHGVCVIAEHAHHSMHLNSEHTFKIITYEPVLGIHDIWCGFGSDFFLQ
jgi:hypothetical protein